MVNLANIIALVNTATEVLETANKAKDAFENGNFEDAQTYYDEATSNYEAARSKWDAS